jgi:hypothetical protein
MVLKNMVLRRPREETWCVHYGVKIALLSLLGTSENDSEEGTHAWKASRTLVGVQYSVPKGKRDSSRRTMYTRSFSNDEIYWLIWCSTFEIITSKGTVTDEPLTKPVTNQQNCHKGRQRGSYEASFSGLRERFVFPFEESTSSARFLSASPGS